MIKNINNINVNYIEKGEGQNIILLHGWGVNINYFNNIINFLSNNFKVYALDIPGFGLSDIPKNSWNLEDYSDFILQFINKLNIDNPYLIGHSFGGRIILKLLGDKKINIDKIVLIDSAGIKKRKGPYKLYKIYRYKLLKAIISNIYKGEKREKLLSDLRSISGSKDYNNTNNIMRDTMVKIVNEDLSNIIPNIKSKCLLLWGELDNETPLRHGKRINKMIENSELVVIKNAGHTPFLDKPHDINKIIEYFLKNY